MRLFRRTVWKSIHRWLWWFLRFISNILAIFVQWKGVTIHLNYDYISSQHDVTAGNHYIFLATSLRKWVLLKEDHFYKWQRNLSLVIPVNTSVCFVLSFADRRRLYLRCDTRIFFRSKLIKICIKQMYKKCMLNVSHYHH